MNRQRRQRLSKTLASLQKISLELYEIAAEEQTAHDNLPKVVQADSRGQLSDQAAIDIDDASDAVDKIIKDLMFYTQPSSK